MADVAGVAGAGVVAPVADGTTFELVTAVDVGELVDGVGRGVTLTDGRGERCEEDCRTDRAVVLDADVVDLSDEQVFRCLRAIHPGAPFAIASSGQVSWYIDTSRTARQRPSRNATQYGSPDCSLAITAHPPPQSMMREPLAG